MALDIQDLNRPAQLEALASPGLVVTEPREGLLGHHGCEITVHRANDPTPIDVAVVSDRHFIGKAEPPGGYGEFVRRYLPDVAALAAW